MSKNSLRPSTIQAPEDQNHSNVNLNLSPNPKTYKYPVSRSESKAQIKFTPELAVTIEADGDEIAAPSIEEKTPAEVINRSLQKKTITEELLAIIDSTSEFSSNNALKKLFSEVVQFRDEFDEGFRQSAAKYVESSNYGQLNKLLKIFKQSETSIIHKEKIAEALGNGIDAFIHQKDPMSRSAILFDSENNALFLQSEPLKGSQNLCEDFEKMKDDNKKIRKPIKGLYEAIIIRMFLGDPVISMNNMAFVEEEDHCRVGNINFSSSFTFQHQDISQQGFTADNLLKKIQEVANSFKYFNRSSVYDDFLNNSNPAEIEETLKKIVNLKGEDLQRLTDQLAGADKQAIPQELRDQYLAKLKASHDAFAAVFHHKNKVEENPGAAAPAPAIGQETKSAAADVVAENPVPAATIHLPQTAKTSHISVSKR